MNKITKEESITAVYGVICGGYKHIFENINKQSLDYTINPYVKEGDPLIHFKISNSKKSFDTTGLLIGYINDGIFRALQILNARL